MSFKKKKQTGQLESGGASRCLGNEAPVVSEWGTEAATGGPNASPAGSGRLCHLSFAQPGPRFEFRS